MSRVNLQRPTVVVIGGGIAGLAAANRVHEMAPHACLHLLEASDRLGGLLQTHREHGYLVEEAAENFITQMPAALDLCRRIGFDDQLIPTSDQNRGAMVVRGRKLHPIPPGFTLMSATKVWPILTTRILSLHGKLRLALEPLIAARGDAADESVASFARRRLGREAYERLVEPLVASIYGTNPDRLSLQATLPQFADMERQHGSLWLAGRQQRKQRPAGDSSQSGARYSLFTTPRDGMGSLVAVLAARLPEGTVLCSAPAQRIDRTGDGRWAVRIGGRQPRLLLADAIVLASPAFAAAHLLRDIDRIASDELDRIDYRGGTIVALGYRHEQVRRSLNSFGLVVPQGENCQLLSASFTSIKYVGRAPDGEVQLRAYLRHDQLPATQHGNEQLEAIACAELAELLAIEGPPRFCRITRHQKSMPVYRIGHLGRVARIEQRLSEHQGLVVAGAAYHGVGVPNCIRSGEQAAETIAEQLRSRSSLSREIKLEAVTVCN